ncbi:MAG: LysR family transcriptional regulator [Alphaproteobacteria bacterium]|nr:MAG: LysR family transcriptional regulator [Alphaproteobacteria bacterium]
MEWDKLKTFYHVTRSNSFTKAAELINLTQSAVSRQIITLEEQAGVSLFVRTKRGLVLTKEGEILFGCVQRMYNQAERARSTIHQSNEPKGQLRVAITTGFFTGYFAPLLDGFLKQYPDIHLSIESRNNSPDWNILEFDLSISPLVQDRYNLVHHHLLANEVTLYASPEYLQKKGTPRTIQELDGHSLISFGIEGNHPFHKMNWHLYAGLREGDKRQPYFEANNPEIRVMMARQHHGIATISEEHPDLHNGTLVRVLPDVQMPIVQTYMMYPLHMQTSACVRVFRDYFIGKFREKYGRKCYSNIVNEKIVQTQEE